MSLELKGVDFTYLPGTPMAVKVLEGIDLTLSRGEILCLMGKTGAGKSTLLQVMGGLLLPTGGGVVLDGERIAGSRKAAARLRSSSAVLMQSPERQLFSETVEKDVAFGPRNHGVSGEDLSRRVREALIAVGMEPQAILHRSPFHLSRGEMRRVAMAGVLALSPHYLLLDEPTSGLDLPGRESLHRALKTLRDQGNGILLVTHDWEEVELLADRVCVLSGGRVTLWGTKQEVLPELGMIREAGLMPHPLMEIMEGLRSRGWDLNPYVSSPEKAAESIAAALRGGTV